MHIGSSLRFAAALIGTNLRASFALRGAFWLQAFFMLANNGLFFVFWWLLFQKVESLAGWRIADVMTLYGVVAGGFGLAVIFGGGVRDLARSIAEGDLDAVLAQPRSVLLHTVASRTYASGWGDLASGLLFIGLSGQVELAQTPLVALVLVASAVVFVASGVIFHSLAFWLGPVETLARQLWESLVMFGLYPQPLFTGALQLVLFTLVPAAFVGYLPAELLRRPTLLRGIVVLAGAAAYASLAVALFSAGLRRYASGNRFGLRA